MGKYKNQTTYCRATHNKDHHYTSIAFSTIRDERLTSNELGILVYILSHADTFIINKNHIQKWSGLGDTTFSKSWNNLKQYGYISGQRILGGYKWTIKEELATTPENKGTITPDYTSSENTSSENTGSENRVLSNIEDKEILKESNIEGKEVSFTPIFKGSGNNTSVEKVLNSIEKYFNDNEFKFIIDTNDENVLKKISNDFNDVNRATAKRYFSMKNKYIS